MIYSTLKIQRYARLACLVLLIWLLFEFVGHDNSFFASRLLSLKKDIIRMIIQYLSDEGYTAARTIIYDEANVKWHEREERVVEAKRLKKAILGIMLIYKM